jgi:HK97 family phage major capsid protein
LGARVVFDEDDLPIAAMEKQPPGSETAEYVEQPRETMPESTDDPELKRSQPKKVARVSERHLHPKRHELAVKVIIPNELACTLAENPELAWALKQDLARALALRADQALLHGDGAVPPRGITQIGTVDAAPAAADPLALARDMVTTVRLRGVDARFGCAGWILHPNTLDALSTLTTPNGLVAGGPPGWVLDGVTLLTHDGHDGGVFLGYPFVVTTATQEGNAIRVHFSADWSEAWIGVHRRLVTIDVSVDAHFQTDETVIRAVMHHDFVVRRPGCFTYAEWQQAEWEARQRDN